MDIIWKENNIFYNVLCFLITENEKLFDSSDKFLYWRTVLHMGTLILYGYLGIWASNVDEGMRDHPEIIIQTAHKYKVGLLTGWNIMFQSLFVAIALIYDLLEWTDRQDSSFGKKLKYYRDVLFCSIVTPLTLFVTCMFWSVYAVDRTLVFPVVFDDVVPWWFNHCVHTNITVVVLLETILTARRHPADPKLERKICAAICIAYAVVYYSIYLISHRWLYDVFGKMTWWQICLFQCVIFVSFFIFYVIQFPINRLFHRADDEKPAKVEVQSIKNDDQTNGVVTIEDYTKTSGNEISFLDQPWSLKHRNYNPRDILSEKTKL